MTTTDVCTWTLDDEDSKALARTCGSLWCFESCGPTENEMRYCPYCGKPLVEVQPELGEKEE